MYIMGRPPRKLKNSQIAGEKPKKKAGSATGELKSIPLETAEKIVNAPNAKYITAFRNRMVMKMMLYCGLRVGEVCGLQMKDLNLKQGTLKIREGKTAAARRTVPWPKEMDFELATWLERRKKELPFEGKDDWVFPTTTGQALSRTYVYGMVKRMCKRAGVDEKVHPHVFRHTGAHRLLENGATVAVLQDWLGHTSPTMSLRYARAHGRDVRKFVRGD